MSISSTSRKAGPYSGNDVATAFAFAFKVFSTADVLVVFTSAIDVETDLTLGTDYTVTLNSNQDSNPGGTVTLPAALVTGAKLTITSDLSNLQPVTLTNNGGFYPTVINDALDRATIQIQQLKEKLSRALVWPISFSGATLPIPEASKFIGWNATADSLVNLDGVAVGDAQTVLFTPAGTGAVATDVQSKLRESVSVKDFGAVGDGVSSDQSALEAAVAASYLSGDWLYWPDGTYVSTASIPNFHLVRHFGPGAVKRGSDVYTPDGSNQAADSCLYVATSGSGSNDGLSATEPFLTAQEAFDALKNAGQHLRGSWRVALAAGTYNSFAVLDGVTSDNRIEIFGPDVSAGVPTAIVDGTGLTASSLYGWLLTNGVYAKVKDIKLYNWNGGSGVGPGDASVGLNVLQGCNVWADNVDADLCGTGHYFTRSRGYVGRGRVTNCDAGSLAFASSQVAFGYGAATEYTGIPIAITCRDASSGAVENGAFDTCGIGVKTMHGSILRVSNSTFTGSTTSDTYSYTGSSITFGTGNTYTSGKKFKGQFSIDLENANQFYYDGDTDRFGFGVFGTPGVKFHFKKAISGAAFSSSTQFIFEDASPQIGLMGDSASTSIFGFNCSVPSVSQLAAWQYVASDNTWRMRINNADAYRWSGSFYRPATDNTATLGAASFRWSTVYAGTGTINTSDAREKQQIRNLSDKERAVASRIRSLIRAFKFNDAVAEKGNDARIHVGVLAQDVKEAFEREGLDGFQYAVLCWDEWPELPEERDGDGNVIQAHRPAGNRWGIRYDELYAFLFGAMA